MIVIYDKANTLNLSYSDDKGAIQYKMFVPGENTVASEVWKAIIEANKERFEHYGKFLYALNEEAAGDGPIDYAALKPKELSDLINNTMDFDKLGEIESAENGRDKPRKAVLTEIESQIKKIADRVEKFEKGE